MKAAPLAAKSGAREPIVLNALLRCVRKDKRAAPVFERIDQVPGLWVLELGPFRHKTWSGWLPKAQAILSSNSELLGRLTVGSSDYTLHISVELSECFPITIPPSLSIILARAGITLELYHELE